MSTARDYLAAVQQRADAATDGPWTIRRRENAVVREPDGLPTVARLWVADVDVDHENAEFIAASRTDVPRLVAALTAVLDLADMGDDRCDYGTVTGDDIDYSGPIVLTRELHEAITNALTSKEDDS